MAEILVLMMGAVVGGGTLAWFFFKENDPENATEHGDDVRSGKLSRGHFGPGGPGAESQRPEDVGNAWNPIPPPPD